MRKSLGKNSGWIVVSVIEHKINTSKYNPLAGSSYIQILKELHHPRKGSINIQKIDDNESFKRFLVKYLNPADHHPATKADIDFSKWLNCKDIKCSVKTRDIHKIETKELHRH